MTCNDCWINSRNTGFNEWITICFDKGENASTKVEYLVHLDHAVLNTAGFTELFVSKSWESMSLLNTLRQIASSFPFKESICATGSGFLDFPIMEIRCDVWGQNLVHCTGKQSSIYLFFSIFFKFNFQHKFACFFTGCTLTSFFMGHILVFSPSVASWAIAGLTDLSSHGLILQLVGYMQKWYMRAWSGQWTHGPANCSNGYSGKQPWEKPSAAGARW